MNNPTGYYYIDNITNVSYVLAKINTIDIGMDIVDDKGSKQYESRIDNKLINELTAQIKSIYGNTGNDYISCLSKYNFFPQIANSLLSCFPEAYNEDTTIYEMLTQETYGNYILLTLDDLNKTCSRVSDVQNIVPNIGGFVSIEFNKPMEGIYKSNNTNDRTNINYIWNVCKGINALSIPGLCKIMIQMITKYNCNELPYILHVANNNIPAITCYNKSNFQPLKNIKSGMIQSRNPNETYMIHNTTTVFYNETGGNMVEVIPSNEHTFILIAHGLESNEPEQVEFPFKSISFYAYAGISLNAPSECDMKPRLISEIPTETCYNRIITVESNIPTNDKIYLRKILFSTKQTDVYDGKSGIIGLYHCNYGNKLMDWNDLNNITENSEDPLQKNNYEDPSQNFNYEDLFTKINEYCDVNKIPKQNVVVKIFACRGYCDDSPIMRPKIKQSGGVKNQQLQDSPNIGPTEMSQEELINWLNTCENTVKYSKGGSILSRRHKGKMKTNKKKTVKKTHSQKKLSRKHIHRKKTVKKPHSHKKTVKKTHANITRVHTKRIGKKH